VANNGPVALVRRSLFGGLAALAVGSPTAASARARPLPLAAYGVTVRPRSDWAKAPAKGPLPSEPDVRLLLVHHSASSNNYTQDAVPGILRGFFGFHTGPEKGWPDVAYNFFVDRFGTAWEGRTGSLNGWVAGSATGGNQGYSQLVCLVGDYAKSGPTPAQESTLVGLLAALADRHQLSTSPDAVATFVSKGSNKFKRGTKISTPTINGHRSMSSTSCPGDGVWNRLPDVRAAVHQLRSS
jgi:hypothetical protein